MKLSEKFNGYVIAKVMDSDVPYYKYEISQALKEADKIKLKAYVAGDGDNIPICSGGLKYTYLWNDDITLKYLIYNKEFDIYESMDMNVESEYYVKILKITE
jgi:hypothetical protein